MIQDVIHTDRNYKEAVALNKYNETHETLKNNINKMREEMLQNKIRKFERDTRDYKFNRVYSWMDDRKKYQ